MTDVTSLQQVASLIHALALALSLACLAWLGILAGLSRLHWFWRLSLLGAPLVMLLPIRAYEPLVLLGPLIGLLALTAAFLRPRWEENLHLTPPSMPGPGKQKTSKTSSAKNSYTVSLGDLLLGMTVIGTSLAVFGQFPWRNLSIAPVGFCFDAALFYLLSLSCLGVVGLRRGAVWAVSLFTSVFIGIVFITTWGDGLRAIYLLGLDAPRQLEWIPLTLFFLTFVTLLTVGLWLMRWCWLAPRPVQFAQRRRLVGSLLAVAVAPAIVLYMAMFVGPAEVPGPKVYDNSLPNLVDIALRLDSLGVGESTLRELRRDYPTGDYVPKVEALYEESLRAVQGPGCVALDVNRRTSEDSLSAQEGQLAVLRAMARRWSREAEHAFRSGDVRLATEFDLAILRLGNHLSRGGIRIHAQAATSIKSAGLSHLTMFREHVPIDLIPTVVSVLERLDAGEEDPQLTHARDRYWTDLAHGWRHRLETVVQRAVGLPNTETAAFQALKQPLAREAAQRRLLGTDLALRHYHQEYGQYPATLAALVPVRLAMLPVDPFTQEILIYRPLRYSFALYSTGPDARDDGGHFNRFPGDNSPVVGQDWNLETLLRGGWRHRREFAAGFSFGQGPRPGPPNGPAGWTAPPWERPTRRRDLASAGEATDPIAQTVEASEGSPQSSSAGQNAVDAPPANAAFSNERIRPAFDPRWRGRRMSR